MEKQIEVGYSSKGQTCAQDSKNIVKARASACTY